MNRKELMGSPCLTPRVMSNKRLFSPAEALAPCFAHNLFNKSMYPSGTRCSRSAFHKVSRSTVWKASSKPTSPIHSSALHALLASASKATASR
eukprot:6262290-Pyramimonas_sp.AAC.1